MKGYLFVLFFFIYTASTFSQVYEADISAMAESHSGVTRIVKSELFGREVLEFTPAKPADALLIFGENDDIDWQKPNYLVIDVVQKASYSGIIYIDFYGRHGYADRTIVQQGGQENKAQITPKIGFMPNLRTQVIFPLSYLDGQNIFMDRFPRQLKGTVLGRRLERQDIGHVKLRIGPVWAPQFSSTMEIASIRLVTELPAPLSNERPVVDKFGQWSAKAWAQKVVSEDDLNEKMKMLQADARGSEFPDEWSRFGGWRKKRFNATGFFRTHYDGSRWWLVDPEGYVFISAGVDCIAPTISGPIDRNEDLFEWIPGADDSRFAPALSKRGDVKMVDFLKVNLIRVFGEQWESSWQEMTRDLMKKFRINTVANWSSLGFAQMARLPYTIPLREYPSTEVKLFRDFPDVFDPVYKQRAEEFAKQLEPFRDDPYLIGYFLSNEPHWAFGEHFIAFEMFGTSEDSYSKRRFVSWLQDKYGSVDSFNKAWSTAFSSVEDLLSKTYKANARLSEAAMADMKEFSGVLVDQYVEVVCNAVKKVDPNHLNLGLRYAWISSELCYRAGAYFDVFSINGYSFPGPPETTEIARRSNKPIMIGEYHFGSTDRGLPANGIQGAADQRARGEAYRYYLENAVARPEVVGVHYFQWNDQPIMGRFDGENYNIGFFDICNQPYEDLLKSAVRAHEGMYGVAAGKRKPFSKIVKKMPPIFY